MIDYRTTAGKGAAGESGYTAQIVKCVHCGRLTNTLYEVDINGKTVLKPLCGHECAGRYDG